MKKYILRLFAVCLSATVIGLTSCVPAKLYNEARAKKAGCEEENNNLRSTNLALETGNHELQARVDDLNDELSRLKKEQEANAADIRKLTNDKEQLQAGIDILKKTASGDEATRQLIRDLQKTQENLQKREDESREKERLLTARKDSLDLLTNTLSSRNIRLAELERMINAKDSVAKALKNTLAKALVGFTDQGLSIQQKNGKVYVMLEERLLFATGSTTVDPKGVNALKELAAVLEKNPDINIQIEGHTDNVPMKGNGDIKDNWDLSVMRATSVVKIITSNSRVNPSRLTASGRGEFVPSDKANTAEARQKNRRIEVILSPKLDEIYKALEARTDND